jgi:periplasmic divalent cation tolerance protein
MEHADVRVLLVTAPATAAEPIAHAVLDRRLAACVNLVPGLRSLYWWEGEKDEAEETLLVIKTRDALVEEATRVLVEAHPYETPEVLAIPVVGGHLPYLDWVRQESTGPRSTSADETMTTRE